MLLLRTEVVLNNQFSVSGKYVVCRFRRISGNTNVKKKH